MKKPIILILTASLLLFIALPSINAGPPPPNQVSVDRTLEGHPWSDIDSSSQPDQDNLTVMQSESTPGISNDNWLTTLLKNITKNTFTIDIILIMKFNELVDGYNR